MKPEAVLSGGVLPVVAPPAGAWIETFDIKEIEVYRGSRAPRGRVD